MRLIKLKSSDGEIFEVDTEIAKLSITIRTMLYDLDEEEEDEPVFLPSVKGDTLERVIEWNTYHKKHDFPCPPSDEDCDEINITACPFDDKFLDVDQATLYDIIMAANFLDIPGLLELCCQKVASMIKGKSPEEIRETFNIKNDFTPEEYEEAQKTTEWCQPR